MALPSASSAQESCLRLSQSGAWSLGLLRHREPLGPSAQVLSFWLPVALAAVCSDLGGGLGGILSQPAPIRPHLEEAAVNTAHYFARVLMQVLTHYRVRN
ncbi:MAG TPA: hypothetical protein VJ756_04460, partial [Terriglobales bacterium]|nr:hypothetical protein [Terriglobales bacterium]